MYPPNFLQKRKRRKLQDIVEPNSLFRVLSDVAGEEEADAAEEEECSILYGKGENEELLDAEPVGPDLLALMTRMP